MTSLVASRLASHFGLYHFSVREHILSLAKSVESDPVGAYKAGSLGWLHPEALARYVNEDRIHEIPGKLLVGLVRKKIDALVAEGHRRFVMTDHPESIDAFTRFLGLQGERGISDVKCVVWLHDLTQASVISNDRKLAMKYFRATNREISVQVDGRSGDEVYGDLMRAFYQRVLAAGGGFLEEKGDEAMDADVEKEEIEGPKRVDFVRT
ncbi:uncharacterized protein RCC_04328 [Ramularia collo-cygni]|uniref:Uncharacterized protein n=1 Tax=Ramularia collo-cygni TaxID=112498 RepID=A0A2D3VD62_9PEZI|nr:uncharacterized protein RCC_04328 [Ramularia collo-cygni]CZT18483.1 uncharacterized protein RCC_04328 [Ramularia collo-cygni]